jgi:hypothetical protein
MSEEFYVPPEQEEGVYAENMAIWHTPYGFVLDFGVYELAQQVDPEDHEKGYVTPIRVTARVRIPAGLAFDMIRLVNARMEAYEQQFGEIRRPGEGHEDPDGEEDS